MALRVSLVPPICCLGQGSTVLERWSFPAEFSTVLGQGSTVLERWSFPAEFSTVFVLCRLTDSCNELSSQFCASPLWIPSRSRFSDEEWHHAVFVWSAARQSARSCVPSCEEDEDEAIANLIDKENKFMCDVTEYVNLYDSNRVEIDMRTQMISWMLDVKTHYGFSSSTAFLSRGKAWLLQLVAVASISLAAKLEETYVPLPFELQIGDLEYVFESSTIQRMELLILSTLHWEMSFVTPFSYLHYLLHKACVHGEFCEDFIARCEKLILFSCRDLRFSGYTPSAVAIASLMHASRELPSQKHCLQRLLLSLWPAKRAEVIQWTCAMDEMLRVESLTSSKGILKNLTVPKCPKSCAVCAGAEKKDRITQSDSMCAEKAAQIGP
ncbi:hypothetical protein KP509_37G055700 [Ceratopteris richardii]|uniref:Cyclin N-terminal domain-containing protein n=1 Tax=Ceratopteris richardii TaxID=49495 RepID=A0A8T2Q821_CERRI|nr:hypothetical protein KP509_37G055700 [Ceratopteris richardii]